MSVVVVVVVVIAVVAVVVVVGLFCCCLFVLLLLWVCFGVRIVVVVGYCTFTEVMLLDWKWLQRHGFTNQKSLVLGRS